MSRLKETFARVKSAGSPGLMPAIWGDALGAATIGGKGRPAAEPRDGYPGDTLASSLSRVMSSAG